MENIQEKMTRRKMAELAAKEIAGAIAEVNRVNGTGMVIWPQTISVMDDGFTEHFLFTDVYHAATHSDSKD